MRIGIGAACIAALLVLLHETDPANVWDAIRRVSALHLLTAIGLTMIGFTALGTYDVLALRSLGIASVSASTAWNVGARAYAVSNMCGFAFITGGAVRAAVYGRHGVALPLVAGAMALSWSAFWIAVAAIVGSVMVLDPTGVVQRLGLPPVWDRVVGGSLLLALVALFAWLAAGQSAKGRHLRLGRWSLRLPTLGLAVAQAGLALVDIGSAALTLWLFMPADVALAPDTFFVAYVVAVAVGLISHSPGGLGAFELTLLGSLALMGRADAIAALLLYRLVRFVLPFAVVCAVAGIEWVVRRLPLAVQKK